MSNPAAGFSQSPSSALPNKRLKLAGALVLKEAVGSCPGGHGTSSDTRCADGAVRPQLKRDPLGRTNELHTP